MIKYDLKFEKIRSVPGFCSAVLPMCQRKSSVATLWKSGKSSAVLPVRQSAPEGILCIYWVCLQISNSGPGFEKKGGDAP